MGALWRRGKLREDLAAAAAEVARLVVRRLSDRRVQRIFPAGRGAVTVLRSHGPTGEARARTLRVRASAACLHRRVACRGALILSRPSAHPRVCGVSQGDTVVTYVYELTGPDEVAVKKIVHTKPATPEPAIQRA